MSDAPPPPANSRISSFMLPPAEWKSPGGRIASKSERFPTPKANDGAYYPQNDVATRAAKSANSGYSMRSRSPRLTPTRAPAESYVNLRSPLEHKNVPASAAFRSKSPRLPEHRATSDSYINLRSPLEHKNVPASAAFRSKSPRLPETRARTPEIQYSNNTPQRVRTTSLRTSSPRFPTGQAPAASPLGPSDWTKERLFGHQQQTSAAYRSATPRLSHHKPYQGAESPITIPGIGSPSSRSHNASCAAFRSKSPRLPAHNATSDSFSNTPVVRADGKSAVMARADRSLCSSFRNSGHEFGDGSRNK